MIKCAILTISDTCYNKLKQDLSGPKIKEMISNIAEVIEYEIVPDEEEYIIEKLIKYSDELMLDLILTTGGTGFSSRDITPEATSKVIQKEIPGIPEYMRMATSLFTKKSILSRGKAGIRGKTLIINLPGSLKSVEEMLSLIIDVIPHSIDMINNKGH